MAAKAKTVARTAKKPAAKKSATKRPAGKSLPYAEGKWAAAFDRKPGELRHWLVKTEPETFSLDDLLASPGRTTCWDGVRNYAARNFLRDGMKLGDRVYFYLSSIDPQVIVAICEVVREGYPDTTAFDRKHHGYDPESDPASPTWYVVDLKFVERLPQPVALEALKARPELARMALLRIGRMSVTPVTTAEWDTILAMSRR